MVRVLEVADPRPPRGDELLVRVHASSVNGTDLGIRRGDLPLITVLRRPFPLGFDLAGTVVGRGPAVTGFELGDRVCALIGHTGGAQSELALVRQGRAAHVPDAVPMLTAAALPLAGLTALQGLQRAGGLPGRTAPAVLILGASGGIGSIAVQLAEQAGAVVTASTTSRSAAFVGGLGADEIVDRQHDDPLRGDRRWDVIFDTPGRVRLRDAASALAPGGMLISTRGISVDAVRSAARRDRTFAAVRTSARSLDLAHLLRLITDGRLHTAPQHVFPLADIAAAHALADRGVDGKIVITLASDDPPR